MAVSINIMKMRRGIVCAWNVTRGNSINSCSETVYECILQNEFVKSEKISIVNFSNCLINLYIFYNTVKSKYY